MNFRLLKMFSAAAWLILLALLINRDILIAKVDSTTLNLIEEAEQERYYGVYLKNKRIGYVEERLRQEDNGQFILNQKARLHLNVLDSMQTVDMDLHATLAPDMHLQDFRFTFTAPFSTMNAEGTIQGNTVSFLLNTGQETISDSITLAERPLLPLNDRSYLLRQIPNPGDKVKIPFFDPMSLTPRTSTVEYLGMEKQLIGNRVRQLHHFEERFSGIRLGFWLNEKGQIVKETSPTGFTFLAEPEFRAKDIAQKGNELLSAVAVAYSGELPNIHSRAFTCRLTLPPDTAFDLHGGRQQMDGNLLTIAREDLEPTAPIPSSSPSCTGDNTLQASRYVQAGHPDILARAQAIVGTVTDPMEQVRLLTRWIYENLARRPVLGLPDALTTLRNLRGDCNEHAALFAALARSLGLPTTIATGVTLYRDAFYYHSWNEVCIKGQWISVDSTVNQLPADLFHIRFIRGDMDQQLKIGALLGKLNIQFVETKAL